jgi:integrase
MVKLGHDVAREKQDRKRDSKARNEAERAAWTVSQLADEYFANAILGRWKHPNIVRARIENDIKPRLGKKKLADVRPGDIDALLKAIVKRGAPTMANDVLRWLKRMFDYAIKREKMQSNPAAVFDLADAGGKEDSRDRWLTRDELGRLFAAMRDAAGSFTIENAYAVKLLLMLAVRKEELIGARWQEFDLDGAVWMLPGERTKTGSPIDIPLPASAVIILRELNRLAGGSAWVFPARKMQSRQIPHIDLNTVGAAIRKHIRPRLEGVPDFTIHDFRRTARTHLADLGVDPHVAERCLNHKIRGVEGIYNRHAYFNERRAALAAWANLLDVLEAGENVVPISKAA